jgi:hypothetical protein
MFPLWFPTQRHSGAPTVTYRRVVFRLNGCFRCRWVTLDADFGGLKIRVSVVQRHPLATIQIGIPRAKRLLRSQSHDQRVSATTALTCVATALISALPDGPCNSTQVVAVPAIWQPSTLRSRHGGVRRFSPAARKHTGFPPGSADEPRATTTAGQSAVSQRSNPGTQCETCCPDR